MKIPSDLKYTKNDEWVRVEGSVGTIGVTDYAQDQLSDIVYVEIIVAEGESVSQGGSCATVESVKAAADVYMPVSGTVSSTNDGLADKPETVNTDPYGEAWMVRIELTSPGELDGLMDAAAYESFCQGREH